MTHPIPPQPNPPPATQIQLTPAFKLIFISVLCLTVLSLVGCFVLVLTAKDPPSDAVKGLIETCSTTWKMGFGAVIGLIGGKVA